MLLPLLVTGVLVKSGPDTGLHVAFLEGDTVAKDYWNLQCLAPAVGETCKNNTGSNNPNYSKKHFLSFCSEVSDCQNTLYFPLDISAAWRKRGKDRLFLT